MPYGTDQGFSDYLAAMGYTLPAEAPSAAILRARGSAYIDGTYEALWTGRRADPLGQADGWPRIGARVNCITPIDETATPIAITSASYRAAWLEASSPGAIAPAPTVGPRVKRQKVDVIEREFFDDGKAAPGLAVGFIDPVIDGAMQPFICANQGASHFLLTVGN